MTMPPAGPLVVWLLDRGTAGHAPKIRRRLKILNAMAYLIAVTSTLYAASYALQDAHLYRWIIVINLALVVIAVSVPLMHRVHEILGGVVIAVTECIALFGLVALLGRDSGIQLNLIVGAAAAFFILGLERLRLIAVLVVACLLLHIAAWFWFPQSAAMLVVEPAMLSQLYISSTLTVFAVTALIVYYAFRLAERAEAETETLLRNTLPGSIVDRLQRHPTEAIADNVAEASILFSDLQSFTPLSTRLGAAGTVAMLNELVRSFDAIAARHGVEKIKTIGDAYMAVAGLPEAVPDHAARLARTALDMLTAARAVAERLGLGFHIRIGIASGPVMAGIIGTSKYSYDVWGHPVNLAARLESTGEPDRIQVSAEIRAALPASFELVPRGEVEIKGIGKQSTWFLVGER